MLFIIDLLIAWALSMLGGALFGLAPFFLGKHMGKPNLGRLGWKWCTVAGLVFLQIPVALGFIVAIFVRDYDYYPAPKSAAAPSAPAYSCGVPLDHNRAASLGISCLSGPMKGRTYPISGSGVMIGRDYDCAVRFEAGVPGVSRHHCSLRYQGGALMLTDLSSAYGTYLSDGRRLPPQYPTAVGAGSRFYVGDQNNLFQIVIIN